jgi:hypothetical protein
LNGKNIITAFSFAFISMMAATTCQAQGIDLISPSGFSDTAENRDAVISFINQNVERVFCGQNSGIECNSNFVLEKKKEDLDAFKELSSNKSKALLLDIINAHCRYDFSNCRYSEMLKDYQRSNTSTTETLKWDSVSAAHSS